MATQIGTVIDGKYEILKQIGKGGMSTVYLAMDKRLNKQWAVKEISRKGFGKNNEEIINEVPADAKMMKSLDHPAIPRIVDIIDHKNNEYIYVVMDYIEGESLDKVIAEYGAQPQDLVIEWAKQICDALGYLHSQKPPIIYRDMKPANVMLKPEGNIKIIDFGIAREYKEGNLADTTVLGTKGFASPEHYGGRQTDERSDIYTLGMTMHNLLTGVDPRTPDYMYVPIRQWNPELSGGLERIIDKCVSPDPKDRYQNCNELLYALDHYTQEEDSFKKTQKRKLVSFIASITFAVIFAVSGLVTNDLATNAKNNNYNNLIVIDNLEYTVANENITKAIAIDKTDARAYESFLDYIIVNENVTPQELEGISTLLNSLRASYPDEKYDEKFAELYYKAGINTFFYYNLVDEEKGNGKDGNQSDGNNNKTNEIVSTPSDRALKAIKFFEPIKDGGFRDSEMATHFYNICHFYKTDVGNSVETPDYVSKYKQVFESIEKCIEYLDNYKEDNANFVKAAMYKSTIDFINTNIDDIAKYSETDKDFLISLLDTIQEKAEDIREVENEKSRAYQTKTYVIQKVPEYKKQVENQYKNLSR